MDLQTIAQLGIACAIAVGAKREMESFRTLFKETLDALALRVNTDGERLVLVETRVSVIEMAVRNLADTVDSATTEDDEEPPVSKEPAGFKH